MFSLEAYKERQTMRYMTLAIFLLVILCVGKYWSINPDPQVSESVMSVEIVSVSEKQNGVGGVGANLFFVTVQLENGQQAKLSISGDSPWVGQKIRVKVRDYASGSRKVTAILGSF